jgi:phage baseplate assembly protein W
MGKWADGYTDMTRHDYAFPFRIGPVSGQAQQTSYGRHVEQMIRQVLLTAPGERADLPQFGCGLRQLLFAPNSDAVQATARLAVQRALNQWLAGQIQATNIDVTPGDGDDYSQVTVRIEYLLIETQSKQVTQILVR